MYPQSDGSIGDGNYAWLADNAHRYGFVLRYPSDKLSVTGIVPSDGHYRYVGRAAAAYIYENGLCLEEFLDRVEQATPEEPLRWDCEAVVRRVFSARNRRDADNDPRPRFARIFGEREQP